jgi:hypothetical protein
LGCGHGSNGVMYSNVASIVTLVHVEMMNEIAVTTRQKEKVDFEVWRLVVIVLSYWIQPVSASIPKTNIFSNIHGVPGGLVHGVDNVPELVALVTCTSYRSDFRMECCSDLLVSNQGHVMPGKASRTRNFQTEDLSVGTAEIARIPSPVHW